MKKQLRYFMTLLLMMVVSVGWCETGVKWVETAPGNLKTGDVVVIVDQYTSRAMRNDGGSSNAPIAYKIKLNEDKSEIEEEVDAVYQWVVTVSDIYYQFRVPNTENYLYCNKSNNGVRVGTNSNNLFSIYKDPGNNKANFLKSKTQLRYLGVNRNNNIIDWYSYESINSTIKYTITAFYKKVDNTNTTESVPVNDKGTATYVTTNALNFSGITDVKAYVATAQDGSNVTFTRVEGAVPAKTPLLVKGKTTDVPVAESADAPEKNLLVAGTGEGVASEAGGKFNFILNDLNGAVGFYHAAGMTVAADRAYLSLSDNPFPSTKSGAKLNAIFSDGETTGINNVNENDNESGKIFNLAGQQMKSAVKGIYIKNGKKFVK